VQSWFRFANQRRFLLHPVRISVMRKRTRRRLCLPDRACSFWRKRENSAADQSLKCRSGGPKTRVNAQIDLTLFGQFSQDLEALLLHHNSVTISHLRPSAARIGVGAGPSLIRKKLVQASRHQLGAENLNAHGHDDVAIAVLVVGKGTQLTG
jgi:hypothetical protein